MCSDQMGRKMKLALPLNAEAKVPLVMLVSVSFASPNLSPSTSLKSAHYAVHWHSLQLIVISYSALWCRPDLKILFVKRPYLWSVESLAGWETDKPSNSHLPLQWARGLGMAHGVQSTPLHHLYRRWGRCQEGEVNFDVLVIELL